MLHPPPGASGMFWQPTPCPSLSRSHGPAPGSWCEGGDLDLPWEVSESEGGDPAILSNGSKGEDRALAHRVSSELGTEGPSLRSPSQRRRRHPALGVMTGGLMWPFSDKCAFILGRSPGRGPGPKAPSALGRACQCRVKSPHPPAGSQDPGGAREMPNTGPGPMTGLVLPVAVGPMLGTSHLGPQSLPRGAEGRGAGGRGRQAPPRTEPTRKARPGAGP